MDLHVLKSFVLGLLFVCLLTLLGIYHVWRQSELVDAGTKLGEASLKLREVKRENALILGEYHALRGNPKILEKARTQLNMRIPGDREIFKMEAAKEQSEVQQ